MSLYIDIHTHRPSHQHTEPTAIGLHPWHAETGSLEELDFGSAEMVGEVGLDFACKVDRERQIAIFEEQLQIAERVQKPVILHCVKAFEPTMLLLEKYKLKAVIFHGFIGSKEQAKRAVERGYYLSFGERTWRSKKTIEALQDTPLDRLFIETDEAETTIVKQYLEVTRVKRISLSELQQAITENYNRIFKHNEQ